MYRTRTHFVVRTHIQGNEIMANKNKTTRIPSDADTCDVFEGHAETRLVAYARKHNLRIGQRYTTGPTSGYRGGFWKRAILHDDATGTHRRVFYHGGVWKYA